MSLNLLNPFRFTVSSGIAGWKFLARTTLGSSNADIDVSSIPNKKYYKILISIVGANGSYNSGFKLGNSTIDIGASYASRRSKNGGSEQPFTTSSTGIFRSNENSALPSFFGLSSCKFCY